MKVFAVVLLFVAGLLAMRTPRRAVKRPEGLMFTLAFFVMAIAAMLAGVMQAASLSYDQDQPITERTAVGIGVMWILFGAGAAGLATRSYTPPVGQEASTIDKAVLLLGPSVLLIALLHALGVP